MQNLHGAPKLLIIALVTTVALTLTAGAYLLFGRGDRLPDLGTMPDFTLIDQNERPVKSADLKGKVLLVGFIYTNCPDVCPLTTTRMRELQERLAKAGMLGNDTMLLSISVDPDRDTPAVLAKYAANYGADTATWPFLTGKTDYVRTVVVEGFHLGAEKTPTHDHGGSPTPTYEVAHSDRLVLVDKHGTVRATFHTDQFDATQVLADMRSLR